jgi:molecular chaperone HscB
MSIPNLDQSYFELFDFEESFALDRAALDDRYRGLQKAFHPDRFAGGTDRQKRFSVQFSSFLNQAHQTLKKSLSRSLYLLSLKGIDIEKYARDHSDKSFLVRQMELREELEAIALQKEVEPALEAFLLEITREYRGVKQKLAAFFESSELEKAATATVKLQFLDKLRQEAEELEAELDY